jgi:5'-nucleotidase/UDP-sugar diphosphatase
MIKLLRRLFPAAALALLSIVALLSLGCAPTEGTPIDLHNQRVRLTLIHTSDIHSRIFPYQYTPLLPDKNAGLQDGKGPYGGMARLAYVVKRERSRSDRALHIDGGDIFQGAPIFNYFNGEAEMRALAETGVDAMVIANHEFDRGAGNVFTQIQKWATFPVLAANYRLEDPSIPSNPSLGAVLRPYVIKNVNGLRVAIIGMGNLSTITSIFELPNRLGILPYATKEIAQFYVDLVRPMADLIVFVTHLGLEVDERMIHETEGIDIVLGGHNHIVVSPPKEVFDCGGADVKESYITVASGPGGDTQHVRPCKPRRVLLMHSGAFAKFVGRLDVDVTDDPNVINPPDRPDFYNPTNGFEVIAHQQQIIPIDVDVAEDRPVAAILEPYKFALKNVGNLDLLVGYAPNVVKRTAPAGGDSQLGNLIATSMWLRLGVQTDFALTNTTGIRSDLPAGPITLEQMFNVFPFDNSITKMQLSGAETLEMFDFATRRSAGRACVSQVQVAGAFVVMNCNACDVAYRPDHLDPTEACAEQIFIGYRTQTCKVDADCDPDPIHARNSCDRNIGRCRSPVARTGSYELATSNYLAGGGSGFKVLQRNTTQLDTKIQQRDAVTDFVRIGKPCGWQQDKTTPAASGMLTCSSDADCAGLGDFVCACPEGVTTDVPLDVSPLACKSNKSCGDGRCVLTACRNDVAAFHDVDDCAGAKGDAFANCRATACIQAGEQCKILACIDPTLGAVVDARLVMLGR